MQQDLAQIGPVFQTVFSATQVNANVFVVRAPAGSEPTELRYHGSCATLHPS
jgi:hypothetical protein